LGSLTSAKGLTLPKSVDSSVFLDRLTTTNGLIVPKNFHYGALVSDYISMDDLISKSLENHNSKTI